MKHGHFRLARLLLKQPRRDLGLGTSIGRRRA
jgi:hypothetical protein